MNAQFYYLMNGQRCGPVSEGQLKELLAASKLRPADQVWREGMPAWIPAAQVPGLVPTIEPAGNKPPPPAVVAVPGDGPSSRAGLGRLLALVGGGGVLLGLVVGLLIGLAVGRGKSTSERSSGSPSGTDHPESLIGRWEAKAQGNTWTSTLVMKSDGTFEIQESFDKLNGPKRSGSWKVVNAEDGKFKLHIVWDTTPDRTAGWVIEQKDDEHLTIVDGAPGFGKKFRRVK